MLDLESAIKHCEEVVEEQEEEAKEGRLQFETWDYISKCEKCASEHRQLAEWLRELKKLREIPDNLVPKYRDGIQDEYDRGANEMLEEVIDDIRKYMEEVNADDTNRCEN